MADQPATWTGYWPASVLAPLLPRPNVASQSITPSSTPVDMFGLQQIIDLRSGEFDQAAAKAGYVTPVASTSAQGFQVARRIVRDGVIADAMRIVGWSGNDPKKAADYEKSFQAALKALEQGDRPLPAAPQDPGTSGRVLPIWSGIASPIMNASIGFARDLEIPTDF